MAHSKALQVLAMLLLKSLPEFLMMIPSPPSKEGDFHFSGRCDLIGKRGARRNERRGWLGCEGIEGGLQGILDELGAMDFHRGEGAER